jgi:hypothetical protein
MRKPSCLISCSQPGPEGGAFAGDGRHGSIVPSPGRVRSPNKTMAINYDGWCKESNRTAEKKMAPDRRVRVVVVAAFASDVEPAVRW